MCVIVIANDKLPTLTELRLWEEANPDGAGYAHIKDGLVAWRKGLTAAEIHDDITAGRVTLPAVFHFRIATIGGRAAQLAHPFPITARVGVATEGQAQRVLFHNGHWDQWTRHVRAVRRLRRHKGPGLALPPGPWSDSRAMAWLAHARGEAWLGQLRQKIAVLSPTGVTRYGDGWEEWGGYMVSNTWFEYTASTQGAAFLDGHSYVCQCLRCEERWGRIGRAGAYLSREFADTNAAALAEIPVEPETYLIQEYRDGQVVGEPKRFTTAKWAGAWAWVHEWRAVKVTKTGSDDSIVCSPEFLRKGWPTFDTSVVVTAGTATGARVPVNGVVAESA